MNKDYIVTERVSTLSFLDEEIFKHYVFLNLGKSVLPLVNDKIDSICLKGWSHIDPNINVTSDSEVPFDDDGEFVYRTLQVAFVGEVFLEKAAVSEDGCGVLMRLEGNISQILPPDIDYTGVLDRIPPYSLSVLANVLSLSLLCLVPPFPSGVLATSLTSIAASSLLTAVVAVTAGPTLAYLLTVCDGVVLSLGFIAIVLVALVFCCSLLTQPVPCVPCDVDAGAAGAKESYLERIDGGLEAAESRLCEKFTKIMRGLELYYIGYWSHKLTKSLRAIGDRIEAERCLRTSDTGSERCKEARGDDDCGMRGADTPVAMGPRERWHEDYSADAVLTRGLSATKEEPESFCAFCSVLERGLRATVRHHGVGLEAKVEQRIWDEWRRDSNVAMCFDIMFQDVDDRWWHDPPAAAVALYSELLKDPRVRAGLKEFAGRLPSSGALSLHALTDTHKRHRYRYHSYRWPYDSGDPCKHCAVIRNLHLEFTGCEGARRVEDSLARVRTAILLGFDRRSRLHSPHYPPLSSPMYRLIHGISLNSFLHRVRIELLRRAMIASRASPLALKSPYIVAASSKVPGGADQ